MDKKFRYYAAAWAVLVVIFNVLALVIPGAGRFSGSFWAGYVMIMLAFAGQLACAFKAFKAEDSRRFFYSVPLITVSFTGLVLTLVCGGLCMLVPGIPYWVGIVLCIVILGFTAVAVIKAGAAAEIVSEVDEKVKTSTDFIRSLTTDAEALVSRAGTPAAKQACRKVYEALRYSDPVSSEALAGIEGSMMDKFRELSAAVTGGAENTGALAAEMEQLVNERNRKCRALKQRS